MEIDFLGLNSKLSDYDSLKHKDFDSKDSDTGEDDISLSLCTSSRLDHGSKEFPNFRQIETWKFPSEKMISTNNSRNLSINNNRERDQSCPSLIGRPVLHPDCFPSNQNQKLTILRNKFEFPVQSASATVFSQVAINSPQAISSEKADRRVYTMGNASPGSIQNPRRGSAPTVAMARRATLARFLEKRSHRLMQTRLSHVMKTSELPEEVFNMSNAFCNKKKKYSSISL